MRLKFRELEVVELTEAVDRADDAYLGNAEKVSLPKGARGTVVAAFDAPSEGYDVEFVDESGETIGILTLQPEQLEAVG